MNYTVAELRALPLFFIVAKGRSGTTLLQSILDTHSGMVVPPESTFVLYLKRFGYKRQFKSGDGKTIVEYLKYDRKILANWFLDLELLEQQIESVIKEGAGFAEICKLVYLGYPSARQKAKVFFLGDKNPPYGFEVSFLKEAFPEAKFFHLIRDYHDCVASGLVTFNKAPVSTISHSWMRMNQQIDHFKQLEPERFHTIIYEDLCHRPQEIMQEVFQFLGADLESEVFKFNERVKQNVDYNEKNRKAFMHAHKDLLNPINTSNIGKYKKQLSEKQIRTIEYIAGNYAKKYGYEVTLPMKKSIGLWFRHLYGRMNYKRNRFMTRLYFNSPYKLRHFFRHFFTWLYRKTGLTNYFNHVELGLNDAAKKKK